MIKESITFTKKKSTQKYREGNNKLGRHKYSFLSHNYKK